MKIVCPACGKEEDFKGVQATYNGTARCPGCNALIYVETVQGVAKKVELIEKG
jgi:uncharacterized Zn finger protein